MCVSPKSVKMTPWMKNHTKVDIYSLPSIEGDCELAQQSGSFSDGGQVGEWVLRVLVTPSDSFSVGL